MLGEAVLEGARRSQGHQPRRLLRDADGRDAGRGRHRSRRPPARRRRSRRCAVRMVGDLQTELVHDFFDGFASGARANVHVEGAVRPIESSPDRSGASRRSRARCAWRARRTRGWRRCCRARRGCCDRAVDYGAGNLTSVRKALTALGADFVVPATPAELRPAHAASSSRASATSRATAALEGEWREAIGARGARQARRCSASASGMQWLFEGSDEAPDVAGLGVMRGRIARLRRRSPISG